MLTWTQQPDGWHAAGFRIELAAPRRWLLLDSDREPRSVALEEAPLAVARSLTECKREAELVAAARKRSELRRKHVAMLLMMVFAVPFLFGSSGLFNVVVGFILLSFGMRSLGVVVGTVLWRWSEPNLEAFYQ